MAHVIQGAMLMGLPTAWLKSQKYCWHRTFVAKKTVEDPEIIASRMAVLSSMEGYSNFDDIYTSLTNLSATNNTNTEVAQR
jgi:hypothetical protein